MPLATCMSRASTESCTIVDDEHGAALDRLADHRLGRDVLRRSLLDEGADPPAGWVELQELAVEAELRAVGGAVDDPPRAADAQVGLAHGDLEMPWPEPATQVLGLGQGAVHEFRWRLEEPADVDRRLSRWRDDLGRGVSHGHVASPCVLFCSFERSDSLVP